MKCSFIGLTVWSALLATVAAKSEIPGGEPFVAGWGIDACLTRHVPEEDVPGYLHLLETSSVRMLRERGVGGLLPDGTYREDARAGYQLLKAHGHSIVAFASLPARIPPQQLGNALVEDLLKVFDQGRILGRDCAGLVDAWEMVGEPDLGFCTDPPDRVAAYQKALYLGLKAGAAESQAKLEIRNLKPENLEPNSSLRSQPSGFARAPLVLMGALGMPPGPWLERAAANGLLDYTDAYNFHFYGHARDLTGVIAAHRAAIAALGAKDEEPRAKRGEKAKPENANLRPDSTPRVSSFSPQPSAADPLPLWITEAGLEAVDKEKDFLNFQRRQLQADFTISTARQALAAGDVAVFMPFILVDDNDPYALTLSAEKPFPAWDAYAKFTRENPWPKRPLAKPPANPNPIVVQWLPDNRTCLPHKVSGTYRFRGQQPIRGELRVYNFGRVAVTGRIEAGELKHSSCELGARGEEQSARTAVTVPAMGMVSVPLEFAAAAKGYFRETFAAAFVETGHSANSANDIQVSGLRSPVSFGLEAWAELQDFTEEPLPLRPLPDGIVKFPQVADYKPGGQVGVWSTMNGLKGGARKPETGSLKPEDFGTNSGLGSQNSGLVTDPQVSGFNSQVSGTAPGSSGSFWLEQRNTDPLAPTMAVAGIRGLPEQGFIRMQLDKPMTKARKVLVVLVDDRGQRYTIWENFGADYYGSRSDLWLNLGDFHADFWGPCSADYRFRPERIREVHLRFYLDDPGDRVGVRLSLLRATSRR